MNFNEAAVYLKNADVISIMPHLSADGDALGSAFSFKLMLEAMGKKVTVYLEEEIQNRYLFAVGDLDYEIIEDSDEAGQVDIVMASHEVGQAEIALDENKARGVKTDLAIIVDCADINRMGKRKIIFDNAKKSMLIDHHEFNKGFADINFIDKTWAATVIGVYYIMKHMNFKIDDKIALLLYVGLVTDTGGFRHTNTNPEAHIIAADLLSHKINPSTVSQNVFENVTKARYMLNGEIIKHAEFYFERKVCICYLPQSVFEYYGATDEDGEGIVDYLRNIEGVEVSIYIKNRDGMLKISMRANNYVDVASIAANFSGGGHKRASGASWNGNYEELKERLLKELEAVI